MSEFTDMEISVGDYFSAVQRFFENQGMNLIARAISTSCDTNISAKPFETINIILEKHGAFYHPAKITVELPGNSRTFCLNTAVSSIGKKTMQNEVEILKRLEKRDQNGFIPNVYGVGKSSLADGSKVTMFLCDWFDEFHEFHLTKTTPDRSPAIVVWDSKNGNFFLSDEQSRTLFEKIGILLTRFFRFDTLEQIGMWHHAAGDFVVRVTNDKIDVRLVTIRKYAPLLEMDKNADFELKSKLLVKALLLFFFGSALRVRIDRYDGTGAPAWADTFAIEGFVRGCFSEIRRKQPSYFFRDQSIPVLMNHLTSLSIEDVFMYSSAFLQTYPHDSSEYEMIHDRLEQHCSELWLILKQPNL